MDTSAYILTLADRCVKCGLCLPQCPTYELTANENESPRGRIALIQGWLTGQLAPTSTLTQHLDQCLLCRRCERVCPSQVAYGEIIDQSKALLTQKTKTHFSLQALITNVSLKLMLNKKISGSLFSMLRLFQKTGLFTLAKKSGLTKIVGLQRLTSYLPELDKPIKTKNFYPADTAMPERAEQVKVILGETRSGSGVQKHQGDVALFTGCLSKQLEPQTINASIRLLNRLGYGVYVPEQQVCCGALHLHEGNKKQAVNFANVNIRTFNQQKNIVAVISLVNGCSSQLREYSQLGTTESFTPEVKDIIEFLAEISWPENITFKALNKKVALQIPCSLQNILRAEDKLLTLIKRIPQLSPDTIFNRCCGAAGSYFLRHPKLSDQLKKQAINKLNQSSPDFIISSNLGCALQLQAGLSEKENIPQVIHPVVLLEQQLM
jgi:glycolate oxidase iron-sulfur subunit